MKSDSHETLSIRDMDAKLKNYRKLRSMYWMTGVAASLTGALVAGLNTDTPTIGARLIKAGLLLAIGVAWCIVVQIITWGAIYSLEGEWHQFTGVVVNEVGTLRYDKKKGLIYVMFTSSAANNFCTYSPERFSTFEWSRDRSRSVTVVRRRTGWVEYEIGKIQT